METWRIKEFRSKETTSDLCRYGKYSNGKCTNIRNANFGIKRILKGKYGICQKDKCPLKV